MVLLESMSVGCGPFWWIWVDLWDCLLGADLSASVDSLSISVDFGESVVDCGGFSVLVFWGSFGLHFWGHFDGSDNWVKPRQGLHKMIFGAVF